MTVKFAKESLKTRIKIRINAMYIKSLKTMIKIRINAMNKM